MIAKESLGEKATNYFAGLTVIFVMTFALTYHGWINGATDIVKHADWAGRLDRHIFQYMSDYISYPLWHFTVKVIYKILGFDLGIAAAMATALFNCAAGGDFVGVELSGRQTADIEDSDDMDGICTFDGAAVCSEI